ncbi:glycerate kinase [Brevibacterium sanguinis]|uniref:Glycerate kinase n=2 Tax=Brevibacterium TaxID=1696 RepID=A0A366IFK6_9MICO|nr:MULTISPECIES: glycerate kinase [Brevibacterium]RBP63480.1 glycerate kinase [Brevibacterium sanguinis]RBP69947.1 glycerate kinase [Brevibacterium celere]
MSPDAPSPAPRIVCAPDSFKGSATAAEAAAALARGARQVFPDAHITDLPFADGGEGTLDALLAVWATPARSVEVVDALGRPTTAAYGVSADGRTAVIEAAQANGLPQVSDVTLEPERADTYGVGLIARHILDEGVEEILLCIGGSATTDGGAGLVRALGAALLDDTGAPIPPGGGGLAHLASVDTSGLDPRALGVRWRIAVDVDNPLTGERGAAAVFGPQKGADPATIARLDAGLAHFAEVLAETPDAARALAGTSGFGAAGGIPLALTQLLGAEVVPGSRMVAETVGLGEALADADIVLTGEGSFDSQSLGGKVVAAVRDHAPASATVVVVAGRVALTPAECREAGVTAALSIAPGPAELAELSARAEELIEATAAQACALLAAR